MSELPKAAIVRIAKAAGAERIGEEAAVALVAAAEEYVAAVAKKAAGIAELCNRVTIKADDIKFAK
ncbi:MAG TPA: NFYB/HAP3 family transcription factor subunit [Methanocorpusculum sp.]|nr:NFYB/HAP3 family transcription factor subunit [Methanocorpusculum sp.]